MEQDSVLIKEKVKSYIHQATHVESGKILNDSLFFKEGYIDSMGFIMLITFIEDEFGLKINDSDFIEENFESINAITAYILRKKTN
jgi:acyl carrier protein